MNPPRPSPEEILPILQRLQAFYPKDNLGALIGVKSIGVENGEISIAAGRLAYVLLRLLESPHIPISPLEIICLGKYGTFEDRAKDETPQAPPT